MFWVQSSGCCQCLKSCRNRWTKQRPTALYVYFILIFNGCFCFCCIAKTECHLISFIMWSSAEFTQWSLLNHKLTKTVSETFQCVSVIAHNQMCLQRFNEVCVCVWHVNLNGSASLQPAWEELIGLSLFAPELIGSHFPLPPWVNGMPDEDRSN